MTKKQKIYLGVGLIALGVFLAFALRSDKEEDSGKTPPPNDDGTVNPNPNSLGSQEPQTVEEQNEVGNPNEILIGDLITPYGEFTQIRETMAIENGAFGNQYEDGWYLDDLGWSDDGKVYSGQIIGKVTNIIPVGDNIWYSVNVCAAANGVVDTVPNVLEEMSQDDCDADVGYVIQSIELEDGVIMPNVKKVIY